MEIGIKILCNWGFWSRVRIFQLVPEVYGYPYKFVGVFCDPNKPFNRLNCIDQPMYFQPTLFLAVTLGIVTNTPEDVTEQADGR